MTAVPTDARFTPEQLRKLAEIEAAPDAEESLRERVARALLTAILGTTDGDIVSGDFEIHASEIARLIVEYGADAALAVLRPADVARDDARRGIWLR